MEALSKMLPAAFGGGFIFGFSMGANNLGMLSISHLLFVDHALISCGPNWLICALRALCLCFEASFGLWVESEFSLVRADSSG